MMWEFDLLQIPILRGRIFTDQDSEHSQPVTLINEALANEYFPNANPLGKEIRISGENMPWLTVIGVVGNLKHTELMNEMKWVETPILYRPLRQEPRQSMQLVLRSSVEMGPLSHKIQSLISEADPTVPHTELETVKFRLTRSLAYPRF